jgi:hypothetical protein
MSELPDTPRDQWATCASCGVPVPPEQERLWRDGAHVAIYCGACAENLHDGEDEEP